MLHQIQRGRVQPLQIVEEESEGVLPRECADESTEDQSEAALRILWRKFRNRRLHPDDELQLRNEIHHELTIRIERLADGSAPTAQLFFVLRQDGTDQALEGLREGRIRDVSLVLVELAGGKKAPGRDERFMEFIDHGGFANTRVAGNKNEFRSASAGDPAEGGEQQLDLFFPSVKLLRDQEAVRHVASAEGK